MAWIDLPDLSSRPPFPIAAYLLPTFLLLVALVLPATSPRSAFILPIILLALIPPLHYSTRNIGGDFGFASSAIYLVMLAADRLIFSQVEEEMIPTGGSKVKDQIGWDKLIWSVGVLSTMRGPGWNWRVKGTPSSSKRSRLMFTITRLLRAVLLYLLIDILSTIMESRPYFQRLVPLRKVGSISQIFINSALSALIGAAALGLLYDLVCVLGVTLRIYSVEECPNLFGSLSHANTLKGFWGKCWHQSFRRVFTSPGVALTRFLSLSPSSLLGTSIILIVAFFLSAIQHSFAMYAMARSGWSTFAFFMLQPVGIAVESIVLSLVGRGGRMKGVGYLWTVGFLIVSSTLFFDDLVQGGMWTVSPNPIKIVRFVLMKYT